MKTKALLAGLGLLSSDPGISRELRDFCVDRPGLGTPACTIDAQHVAVELGLVDWSVDRSAGGRTDSIALSDILIRYGLSNSLEAQIGWQGLGVVRQRKSSGAVDHSTGTGDVRIALRQSLINPDGSGLSLAVMPFFTIPIGRSGIGENDWSAGVLLPVSFELSDELQVAFTGEIEHAADEQGSSHHLAYGGTVGIEAPLTDDLSGTFELAAKRNDERSQPSTQFLTGASAAWLISPSFQLDAGINLGLNRSTSDLELYVGLAKRF